jgi:Family of unknown function (DUF6152)
MRTKSSIVFVMLLMFGTPVFAHHGNAAFELDKVETLQATITQFAWGNPHSIIFFDAKNDKGEVQHWSCESVQPALLHRAGWTRESLKPGDKVTIQLHPGKSGNPVGYLVKVILADGQELSMMPRL